MAIEKHFILDNDGFFIKEERFHYKDVDATYFYYVQTQKAINFAAAGVDNSVTIKIYLKTRAKPITINAGPQYFSLPYFSLGRKPTELLIAKFNEISRLTFNQRAEKYLKSMQEKGYFLYDGKKFFKDGDVVSDKWQANFYTDKPWLKRPFFIFHEKKTPLFFSKYYQFETTMDTDVLFWLLERMYNLRWS